MTPFTVTLHQEPHRHYKCDGSWNIGKRRIAGVTTVLGDQADFLSKWAAGQAYLAATQFGAPREVADLAYERGLGPDAIRDAGELIFVLRPETDEAAYDALLRYAHVVEHRAPDLAADIRRELSRIRAANVT